MEAKIEKNILGGISVTTPCTTVSNCRCDKTVEGVTKLLEDIKTIRKSALSINFCSHLKRITFSNVLNCTCCDEWNRYVENKFKDYEYIQKQFYKWMLEVNRYLTHINSTKVRCLHTENSLKVIDQLEKILLELKTHLSIPTLEEINIPVEKFLSYTSSFQNLVADTKVMLESLIAKLKAKHKLRGDWGETNSKNWNVDSKIYISSDKSQHGINYKKLRQSTDINPINTYVRSEQISLQPTHDMVEVEFQSKIVAGLKETAAVEKAMMEIMKKLVAAGCFQTSTKQATQLAQKMINDGLLQIMGVHLRDIIKHFSERGILAVTEQSMKTMLSNFTKRDYINPTDIEVESIIKMLVREGVIMSCKEDIKNIIQKLANQGVVTTAQQNIEKVIKTLVKEGFVLSSDRALAAAISHLHFEQELSRNLLNTNEQQMRSKSAETSREKLDTKTESNVFGIENKKMVRSKSLDDHQRSKLYYSKSGKKTTENTSKADEYKDKGQNKIKRKPKTEGKDLDTSIGGEKMVDKEDKKVRKIKKRVGGDETKKKRGDAELGRDHDLQGSRTPAKFVEKVVNRRKNQKKRKLKSESKRDKINKIKLNESSNSTINTNPIDENDLILPSVTKMVKGTKILPFHKKHFSSDETNEVQPLLFRENKEFPKNDAASRKILPPKLKTKSGTWRYALSNPEFIRNGYTILPSVTSMRKINIYKMEPSKPESNWFLRHKDKKIIFFECGERFAEIDSNGYGTWYYRNGIMALNYYKAKEPLANERYVVYSSGQDDVNGNPRPLTVLAIFDQMGTGVVYDHFGNERLKFNQSEGQVIDKTIGSVGRWKWNSLNDNNPVYQVYKDNHETLDELGPDPNELIKKEESPKLSRQESLSSASRRRLRAEEALLKVELSNYVKENENRVLRQKYKFEIKYKVFKLNEQFSLHIISQSTIYIQYREGNISEKVNIGMNLKKYEILDSYSYSADIQVMTPYDRIVPKSDSVADIRKIINRVKTSKLKVSTQSQS